MNVKVAWAKLGRVVIITGLVSVPAMILSGYAVYALRNWLSASFHIDVPTIVYVLALVIAVWGAMWVTSGRLISELRRAKQNK